jgi:photosystem II stability/assembly factor-like uncharacterized protein
MRRPVVGPAAMKGLGRASAGALAIAAGMATATLSAAAQEGEDDPRRRWEDFYQRRAFPFARIPAGALQRARQQAVALSAGSAWLAPPAISGARWQPLGPAAIPIYGTSTGRMSAIAVHPTNSNILYVGGAQGGVWKTVDGGSTWTPLTDRECSLAMGSIAIDPINPQIVYAGTGEQHFSGDSYYGCGVLRSTDGGASWTRLGAGVLGAPGSGRISRVVIAPSTAGNPATTTVFAASDLGLFRSTDGGGTWTEVLAGTLGCAGQEVVCSTNDLVVHPTDDSILYAAVFSRGVFKSADRGSTWVPLPNGFPTFAVGRINIAIAPAAPETVYAAVENMNTGGLLGIWRTSDGGAGWTPLAAGNASCRGQCWYDMYVAVHPANPSTVYFGGVYLYRSLDAGASFEIIGGNIHVDQHLMAFDPRDPQTVYAANDGGIYRSTDGGTTWTSLNNGLELTQFYEGISLHPSDQTVVLGGTQDNCTLQYAGQPMWLPVLCSFDGGFTAIDRDDPNVRYAETQWVRNSGYSGPRRSDGGYYSLKINGISPLDPALFIPPLVMDPTSSSTLYFGTYRLYRTTDRGESWSPIMPNLTGGSRLSAIAPAPSDSRVIYVGEETGLLLVTADGGTTWEERSSGVPSRFIEDIAVDRADSRTVYAVVSGFGTGHVFRTSDAGITWEDRSGNLPDVPVNAIVLDPANRDFVMVGTDVGVFISSDGGGSWTALDQGMPNVAVIDIAYNPATAALIAATHGRGMFQLQLNRPLTLAVVPGVRRDTVALGDAEPRQDSAAVVLTGTGAAGAAWGATHSAAAQWVVLTTSSGVGSGTLRWSRAMAGLAPGVHVDTITVAVPGAVDSPWLLFDSLVVEAPLALSVSVASRSDTVAAGATAPRADSAFVELSGAGAAGTSWSAAASRGAWITVTASAGTGSGLVRWTRSPAALAVGEYVDTITVTALGAAGSPARLVDTLVVVVAAAAFDPAATADTALSGSQRIRSGSAQLLLSGGADLTTEWTARHGRAEWLSLQTSSGRGSGTVSWTRSAFDLVDGIYRDTIIVTTAAGDMASLVDEFVVRAPAVTADCAASHVLGTTCLDETELRWLDLAGNRDGRYNLGDLVAFLSRNRGAGGPGWR